jgi:hypothetical protein
MAGRAGFALLIVAGCAPAPEQPHVDVLPPSAMIVSRVEPANVDSGSGNCTIEVLDSMPDKVVRDLGTIEVAGTLPANGDVLIAVKQNACDSGADAILLKKREQREFKDRLEYHVIAEALVVRSDAHDAGVSSPARSASPALEAIANGGLPDTEETGSPSPSPEPLMQPVTSDESDEAAQNRPSGGEAAGLSESSISGTEAIPLSSEAAQSASPVSAVSPIPTATATQTATATATTIATETATATATETATATQSPTPIQSPSASATPTPITQESTTATPSATPTPSATATPSMTQTATPTSTETPMLTATPTETPSTPLPTSSANSTTTASPGA